MFFAVALAGFASLTAPFACSTAELVGAPDASPGESVVVGGDSSTADGGAAPEQDARSISDVVTEPIVDPGSIATSAKVRILVQPTDDPDALLKALRAATQSIHMTMYMLTNNDVEQALVDKHRAGVDVKVILNQNFPQGGNVNASASAKTFQTAGVGVVWAPMGFRYTHSKSVVIDQSSVWVMTMNRDFTHEESRVLGHRYRGSRHRPSGGHIPRRLRESLCVGNWQPTAVARELSVAHSRAHPERCFDGGPRGRITRRHSG